MEFRKKVIVINTGGTIAMRLDESTDAVQTDDVQPLHSIESLLAQYSPIEMIDLFNVPSPHMTPTMMLTLSELVASYLQDGHVAGVVITHGTDTLEETAYFLDLTVPGDKPIVVTGAMRSSNELGADGPVNLVQSVRVAGSEESHGRGCLVVFNDEIHAARHVTKTHTSNVATFQSPGYGPIGFVTKNKITYNQNPLERRTYSVSSELPSVPVVTVVPGMDPQWLDFLLKPSVHGVVVEAFGAGNVPPGIVPLLQGIVSRQLPVVMVSRCYNGYVQPLYGYEGGGKHLADLGVILCNGLNGQKARMKLIVLKGAGLDIQTVRNAFAE